MTCYHSQSSASAHCSVILANLIDVITERDDAIVRGGLSIRVFEKLGNCAMNRGGLSLGGEASLGTLWAAEKGVRKLKTSEHFQLFVKREGQSSVPTVRCCTCAWLHLLDRYWWHWLDGDMQIRASGRTDVPRTATAPLQAFEPWRVQRATEQASLVLSLTSRYNGQM